MPKIKVYRCSTMDLPLDGGPWVRLEDMEKLVAEIDRSSFKGGIVRMPEMRNIFNLQKVDAFTGEEI